MKFDVEIEPREEQNPARTKHLILKRNYASWSQSVFSVPFSGKIVPNRDYPYEGLSLIVGGGNYHILDAIAVGLKKESYVNLKPVNVIANPWRMTYFYEGDDESLVVSYYLLDVCSGGAAAHISVETSAKDASIVVEPLMDIRYMYDDSNPDDHKTKTTDRGMMIRKDNIFALIETPSPAIVKTWRRPLEWWYKLGSGYREDDDGQITFSGETRTPASLGELEVSTKKLDLGITCGASESFVKWLIEKTFEDHKKNERTELKEAKKVIKTLDLSGAAAFRALAFSKFGLCVNDHLFHEAGDFWFRSVWFRDELEGLYNNINTLFKLEMEDSVKKTLLSTFDSQDEFGRMPNRITKPMDYNSADATLLAYIVAGEYVKRSNDINFAKKVLNYANTTISSFEMGNLEKVNGAPVLHGNGLISAVPWHSWTDSRKVIVRDGKTFYMPGRIPEEWAYELIDRYGVNAEEELSKPKYFLPEINAQWILMLKSLRMMSYLLGVNIRKYQNIISKASKSYRATFLNDKFLFNAVRIDGKSDPTIGSPALVAIDMLGDFFGIVEVEKFVGTIKQRLLVKKEGLPFGVLVTDSDKQVYYGDNEYHAGVVWPRDTPYLIRILSRTGEDEVVDDILRSNLNHQMNEGFVFYNSELFSPDNGVMTPVKNPIQWWSQWIDPFWHKSF